MRVLLDCDGVLSNFVDEVLRFCNHYGRKPGARLWDIDDITGFDILESLQCSGLQKALDGHLGASGHCGSMPVLRGAREFVERLHYADYRVVVVTAPYYAVANWVPDRLKWLDENFGFTKNDVVFASEKRNVRAPGDVLVDDAVHNLVGFEDRGILFTQPWNNGRDIGSAYRAQSYDQVLERIRWLEKQP